MISGLTLNTEAVVQSIWNMIVILFKVLFFSLNLFFKKGVAWKSYHSLSKVGSIVTLTWDVDVLIHVRTELSYHIYHTTLKHYINQI